MFNPTPQRAAPQPWVPNAVIQPNQRQGVAGFETTDWDNVPRLDYQTEKFRQLAVPDPARVVDDASQFEPWQPKQLGEAVANKAPSVAPAAKSMPEGATESARHDTTTAFDESGAEASADQEGSLPQETSDYASPTDKLQVSPEDGTHPIESDGVAETVDSQDTAAAAPDAASDSQYSSDEQDPSQATTESEDGTEAPLSGADPEPTQGLDSAAVQEACEAARREGHAQGLEEARVEAQSSTEQAVQAAREQAETDKTQALQALREELEAELEPLKRQLNKTVEQVQSLIAQPDKLYEHVKRLSLHLAEQLVLGELNMSPASIERLIQRCLDELDLHGNHVVTVELNPQDKARLQERAGELTHALSLQAVHTLQPGSVRVVVNDTMVEDLVGNRLDALARSLLAQPEVWREQSPFFRQPLAQRDSDVQDASARTVSSRDTAMRESTVRESVSSPEVVAAVAESPEVHESIDPVDTPVPEHGTSEDTLTSNDPGEHHHD